MGRPVYRVSNRDANCELSVQKNLFNSHYRETIVYSLKAFPGKLFRLYR